VDRPLELARPEHSREVEEGAGQGGHRDRAVDGDLVGGQGDLVEADPGAAHSSAAGRDVYNG
jgi:hypothetical protein